MADTPPNIAVEGDALTIQQKTDLLHRLARVEGQLRGLQKLIAKADTAADVDGIAQQLSAARKALDRSFVNLVTSAVVTRADKAKTKDDAVAAAKHVANFLDKFA